MKYGKITLVGLGLIGGSIGMALKTAGLCREVCAVVRRPESIDECLRLGAADRATLDLSEGVKAADIVFFCTPVVTALEQISTEGLFDGFNGIVSDVCSTKLEIEKAAAKIKGLRFIGSHPMAGSEKSGLAAGSADLFAGAVCLVTKTATTQKEAFDCICEFWKELGSTVKILSPDVHDWIVARVSHLPHLVSTIYIDAACRGGEELGDYNPVSYAGRSMQEMSRVGGTAARMWRDIVATNRGEVLSALDDFIDCAGRFRDAVYRSDWAGLEELWDEVGKKKYKVFEKRDDNT